MELRDSYTWYINELISGPLSNCSVAQVSLITASVPLSYATVDDESCGIFLVSRYFDRAS